MINLILFGPPGAGKGTQADKLVERYGLLHISTGEVIRNEIKSGSKLGMQAATEMEGGKLASDALVISIIADYIKKNQDAVGTIFDGFPRTTPQAEALDKMLAEVGSQVNVMISLEVEDQILIERLMNRGLTSGRADDSDPKIIQNRIDVYKAQTEIVKKHYGKQGKCIEIDGNTGGIEGVAERLFKEVDKFIQK